MRPLRTFGKQPGPTGVTPTMLLWFLPDQDYTHDLCNAKQMANKTNTYWKIDLDAAYFRIHANAKTASTYIAIVNELFFICLRLPFGTTPAPEEYMTVSEAAIDLGNDILQDQSWDTDDLNSPHQSLLPQEEKQPSASHLKTADLL